MAVIGQAVALLKQTVRPVALKLLAMPTLHDLAHKAHHFPVFHEWRRRYPAPQVDNRESLYQRLLEKEHLDSGIDYLEFGVYRGYTIRWWAEHNRDSQSTFVGFDSFEGLPEDWNKESPRGTYATGGKVPDIGDPRCSFVKGMFQDTVHEFFRSHLFDRTLVVHLDADLYSSTLCVLMAVGPHLKNGDVLIFDEFYDYMNEFRALEDYRTAQPFSMEAIGRVGPHDVVALRVL
ncbi:MAG: TylF/MycF/NovP-related O-methyltransferase [bacterium]